MTSPVKSIKIGKRLPIENTMVGLRETLVRSARASACAVMRISDGLDNLLDVPNRPFPLAGQLDDYTDAARGLYRDLICPEPSENPYGAGGPPATIPAQEPGLCPVGYEWFFTFGNTSGIGGPPPGTPQGPFGNLGPLGDFFDSNGTIRMFVEGGQSSVLIANSGSVAVNMPERVMVTRQDGQPDVCPEEPGVPPTPPPFTEAPVTYDDVDGNPIVIVPRFEFDPVIVSPTNDFNLPFNLTYNNFRIKGVVNLNLGGVKFNFGGGSGVDNDCCLPSTPENPTPPDPEGEPDPTDENRIVGVVVTTTDIGQDANITVVQNPNGPNYHFPDLALVTFRVNIDGSFYWLAPQKVQIRQQVVPVLWDGGAVAVSVVSRPGVTLTTERIVAKVPVPGE